MNRPISNLKVTLAAIAACASLGGSLAHADNSPVYEKGFSDQGYEVKIKYQVKNVVVNSDKPSNYWTATPVQIIVGAAANSPAPINSATKARVMLTNFSDFRGSCPGVNDSKTQDNYMMDLQYSSNPNALIGDWFYNAFVYTQPVTNHPPANFAWLPVLRTHFGDEGLKINESGYCYSARHTLQVGVVVDGHWLKVVGPNNQRVDYTTSL